MLHEYTRAEKKKAARGEGPGFDGELNDFQTPELSSLAKVVSMLFYLPQASSDGCCDQDMNEVLQL